MLSRFHLIPERHGQTDRRADRQNCYINIAMKWLLGYQIWAMRNGWREWACRHCPTGVCHRDAIETFKHLHGFYLVDQTVPAQFHVHALYKSIFLLTYLLFLLTKLLPLAQPTEGVSARGHELKLQERACKTSIRANVFGLRIVNFWNLLLNDLVMASSVNCFKGRFDRHYSKIQYCTYIDDNSLKTMFKWRHLSSKSVYRPLGLRMTEEDDDETMMNMNIYRAPYDAYRRLQRRWWCIGQTVWWQL